MSLLELLLAVQLEQAGIPFEREYRFHPTRKWRFDFAFPERRIAVEIQGGVHAGGRHITPMGYTRDLKKHNAATLLGWKTLYFVGEDVENGSAYETLVLALHGPASPHPDSVGPLLAHETAGHTLQPHP